MHLSEIVQHLKPRAQQLRLIDQQTGYVDEQELLGYVHGAVRFLANKYQLPLFLMLNRELLRTVATVDSYALPAHFQAWIPTATHRSGGVPRQPSGLVLTKVDGTGAVSLQYEDPEEFLVLAQSTTTPGPPQRFTVTQRMMTFSPTPDAIYIVQAVERVTQGDMADVPEEAVAAVSIQALYTMASDRGLATPLLAEERRELTSALVNDQARLKWFAAKQRADNDWSRYWTSSR